MTPAEIHHLFVAAVGHHNSGNLAEAEKIYHRILAAHPNHPDALHLLGTVAFLRGQSRAAATLIQQAIAINPKNAEYYSNLSRAWIALADFPAAIDAARKAVALNPKLSHALNNLAFALLQTMDAEPAAEAARAALALDDNPNQAQSYRVLGGALSVLGYPREAAAAFRDSLRLEPAAPITHSDLIFNLEHDPDCDQKSIAAELEQWNRLHAEPLRHLIRPHKIDRSPHRRLRIGWVSGDFRVHVIARCLLPIFQNLNRDQFRNFCYANVANTDEMSRRLFETVDVWRDIRELPDVQAAELIRSDRIDILVDLALHSGTNRLTLFALKPAPLQVSYLGYCGSTGLQTMDYRISDPFIDPPDSDLSVYRERTIHLPHSFLCYGPEGSPPGVSPPPSIANGLITFGCLNNPSKICPDALQLWAGIVSAVPASRLVLHASPGSYCQRVRDVFQNFGVSPDRLEFLARQSWKSYMETYNRIDIALDPFPYGGGVTTCDALLMGVPVVALRGRTAAGRLTFSILSNIGYASLAAESPRQYADIAASLAGNPTRLRELRGALRGDLEKSPVMDPAAAAVNLGKLFQDIWQNYLSSEV